MATHCIALNTLHSIAPFALHVVSLHYIAYHPLHVAKLPRALSFEREVGQGREGRGGVGVVLGIDLAMPSSLRFDGYPYLVTSISELRST